MSGAPKPRATPTGRLIRPGTDAALALGMAHVIVAEGLVSQDFISRQTVGYEAYAKHLEQFTPEWAERETGLAAEDIRRLAREYATTKPAMIIVGGASMYKHRHGWQPGRAIATLPALTGQLGLAGGGLGPRHRAFPTGDHFADLTAVDRRPDGPWVPSHAPIARVIKDGNLDVLLTARTDILSSFSDAAAIERDLERVGLVSPMTSSRIFPSGAWRTASCRARCGSRTSASRTPPRISI
jgi:anaerobic selenocysteine-containing dehydrogenase